MPVFQGYARYYNLLYRDKDYAGETAFVLNVLKKHNCVPQTLLDLGCGTGCHAVEMAKQGVQVTGVDISETMLDMGRVMLENLDPVDFSVPLPDLRQGDVRTIRLGKKFDAVVSLFHVMSYQNTEEDALAVMKTAKEHLNPGGLFLFDFWYGPGVLSEPPEQRERVLENDEMHIHRLAVPEHRLGDNMVVVKYSVNIRDLRNDQTSELYEEHSMRYWFLPELRYLAKQVGFYVIDTGGWLTEQIPGYCDWNAWLLVKF